jgi:hypothetical protein
LRALRNCRRIIEQPAQARRCGGIATTKWIAAPPRANAISRALAAWRAIATRPAVTVCHRRPASYAAVRPAVTALWRGPPRCRRRPAQSVFATTALATVGSGARRPMSPRRPARSGEGAIGSQRLVEPAVEPALLHPLSLARGSPGRPARLQQAGQQTRCDIPVTGWAGQAVIRQFRANPPPSALISGRASYQAPAVLTIQASTIASSCQAS